MANGDVQNNLSDQYLQKFNLPIGVSGMQKLQQFPALQKLAHAGQLSFLKKDFHGLDDFKFQMDLYSSSNYILKAAWALIKSIVPNNPKIALLLTTVPGLGSVGQDFLSISGFAQVFSLTPSDLTSPAAVAAKVSVYQNSSTQTSNTSQNPPVQQSVSDGTTYDSNTQINGIEVMGTPSDGYTLVYSQSLNAWIPAPGGGGGGGAVSSVFGRTGAVVALVTDYSSFYDSLGSASTAQSNAESYAAGLVSALVFPATKAAVTSKWLASYDATTGLFTQTQPAFSDLSSHPTTLSGYGITDALSSSTVLPSTKAAVTSKWLASYDATTGAFTQTQPDYSDLTGRPTLPVTDAGSTHHFLTSYTSSTGAFTDAQPSAADLSDVATSVGNVLRANGTSFISAQLGVGDLSAGALANGSTATTQAALSNDTKVATDAYVDSAVAAIVLTGAQPPRSTTIQTTASLQTFASQSNIYNSSDTESSSFALFKSFGLQRVTVDRAARVRLYRTAATRDADLTRPNSVPPTPGTEHGVICDLYLDGITTVLDWWLDPMVEGYNGDGSQTTSIYYNITNLSAGTHTVQVTFYSVIQQS